MCDQKGAVDDECFDALSGALIESSVRVKDRSSGLTGSMVTNFGKHGNVIGAVNPDSPFPITESAMAEADGGETEFLLDNRHLYLRTAE